MLNSFLFAIQFLTRIPVANSPRDYTDQIQANSMLYYPLVGLLIGGTLVLIAMMLDNAMPADLTAILILGCWAIITGGLHLDGLADSADAWLGGHGDTEKSLEIMKDPRCGSSAVISLVLVLLAKYAALQFIILNHYWDALLIAPILGRTAIIPLFLWTAYVRPNGLGAKMAELVPKRQAKYVLIAALLFSLVTTGMGLVIAAAIVYFFVRQLMVSCIGGTTGDTAGAMIELVEACVLVNAVFIFT